MKPTRPRIKLEAADTINFGKYKGLSIEALCSHKPEYMIWLHDSGKYDISHELLIQAERNISLEITSPYELGGATIEDDPRV